MGLLFRLQVLMVHVGLRRSCTTMITRPTRMILLEGSFSEKPASDDSRADTTSIVFALAMGAGAAHRQKQKSSSQ